MYGSIQQWKAKSLKSVKDDYHHNVFFIPDIFFYASQQLEGEWEEEAI